jgi:hypothetical protein
VLEQTATSRGPALLTPSGPATDDGAGPSEWLVPALVTAAAGVALALVPGRREPEPPAGEFAGPAGRFAQPALGGMVNAGPPDGDPRKPPIDVKQHAWDWGGHYLGGAVILVPAVLGAPVTAKLVVAGVVIALASELKRRLWPSKPLTVNDMVGGNPYERLQKSGNDGLGQKVRDGHGGAEVRKELGPDGNQTTTWGQGTQGVHQETGGQTSGRGDAYRDAIK